MKKVLVASIVVALVALSAPLWAQTAGYFPRGTAALWMHIVTSAWMAR